MSFKDEFVASLDLESKSAISVSLPSSTIGRVEDIQEKLGWDSRSKVIRFLLEYALAHRKEIFPILSKLEEGS